MWMNNNEEITVDRTMFTQTVTDRITATFDSVLTVGDRHTDMMGNYSCFVENVFGMSKSKTITMEGTLDTETHMNLS